MCERRSLLCELRWVILHGFSFVGNCFCSFPAFSSSKTNHQAMRLAGSFFGAFPLFALSFSHVTAHEEKDMEQEKEGEREKTRNTGSYFIIYCVIKRCIRETRPREEGIQHGMLFTRRDCLATWNLIVGCKLDCSPLGANGIYMRTKKNVFLYI